MPAPLIYLIDLAVEIEPALDGRTATITVVANDADEAGEQPPVAGAEITVSGPHNQVLAHAITDAYGVAGVPLPANLEPDEVLLAIHHDDYNPRHLRLDGSNVTLDLRELLYSSTGA